MAPTEQQEWPNRAPVFLIPSTILCIWSTAVLVWRLVYSIRAKRKLVLHDYLLIIAAMLNVATSGIRFKTCQHGLGRHIRDPSIRLPYDILKYSYYLWITQILNLIAVATLKYSICGYLLVLKFSRVYLAVVWASILMVTTFNLMLPIMGCFCSTPFEANWNKSIKGKCFIKTSSPLTYSQGVANCVTDVIYVVAPIIYLSTIQLPRRTQWGLRIVFCLGLIATACSVAKTVELSALMKTADPTWDGVNLAIWSASELSVGILVASLPALRKQFDSFFRRILSSTFLGMGSKTGSGSNGIPLYNIEPPLTVGSRPTGGRSRFQRDDLNDGDSEKCILGDSELPGKREITRTIVHEIRSENRSSLQVPDRVHNMYRQLQ